MAVYIGRHSYGGVPEYFADNLNRNSHCEHEARSRVTQFMNMPITQTRVQTNRFELA